jgi:hypothetical protein
LNFLNDSTGFYHAVGVGVRKTTNYGVDWTYFPGIYSSPFDGIGWYFINPDVGYFIEKYRDNILLITRNTQDSRTDIYADTILAQPHRIVDLYDTADYYVSCKPLNKITFELQIDTSVVNINIHFKPNNPAAIVQEPVRDKYVVFPNPAKDITCIETSEIPVQSILTIFNIQGQIIKSCIINKRKSYIDTSDLPAGIYILRIAGRTSSETLKLIRE